MYHNSLAFIKAGAPGHLNSTETQHSHALAMIPGKPSLPGQQAPWDLASKPEMALGRDCLEGPCLGTGAGA